jgi:hypothetical protein
MVTFAPVPPKRHANKRSRRFQPTAFIFPYRRKASTCHLVPAWPQPLGRGVVTGRRLTKERRFMVRLRKHGPLTPHLPRYPLLPCYSVSLGIATIEAIDS